jgi:hypothetical protein
MSEKLYYVYMVADRSRVCTWGSQATCIIAYYNIAAEHLKVLQAVTDAVAWCGLNDTRSH